MPIIINSDDYTIERTVKRTIVKYLDGNIAFTLEGQWPTDHVKEIVGVVNLFYSIAHRNGRNKKINEIKKVLEISG